MDSRFPRADWETVERCLACEAVVNRGTSLHNALALLGLYRPVSETASQNGRHRVYEIAP